MPERVYLETSVIGYLTSRPAPDALVTSYQHVTREWWEAKRLDFELFLSQLVYDECSRGDAEMAASRLAAIRGIPLLAQNVEAEQLTRLLIEAGAVPKQFSADAAHIAVATVHGVEYLLTWNFKHIANARMLHKIERVCQDAGYPPPIICSPQQLL